MRNHHKQRGCGRQERERRGEGKAGEGVKMQRGLAPGDSDKFHQSSSVKICLIFAVAHSGVGPHHSPII